jgi:hypothetical protein
MKELIKMKPDDLKPWNKNPRDNDKAVPMVMDSILEYGFQTPILVDENLVIIAGHTRQKAAMKLGLKEVDVVITDEIPEDKKDKFRIADNKLGEKADWDRDLLAEIIAEQPDYDWFLAGFSQHEIDKLLDEFNASGEAGETYDNSNCKYPIEPVMSEKYDYVVIFTKNEIDFAKLETILGLQKKQSYKGKTAGKSRVLTFEEFEEKWNSK